MVLGKRSVALAALGLAALALAYLSLPGGARLAVRLAVAEGAKAGDLTLRPCKVDTEAGPMDADCGTLVVPENRRDPGSNLIALPLTRIRATGPESAEPAAAADPADTAEPVEPVEPAEPVEPVERAEPVEPAEQADRAEQAEQAEPVFRLAGGPGATNMSFPAASRLTERHDVVLVGYRGVDGSAVLDCPEVEAALRKSADLAGEESTRRQAEAFTACARRLKAEGVDLEGYSLAQRADDLEAARNALGYKRINLLSQSHGSRTAMIYAWRHPESIHRSIMIGVNPPGHFYWDPAVTDAQLARYAELCREDEGCAARTGDLAGSMRATASAMPDRWGFLPIKAGNVRAATLWGMFDTTQAAAPLNAPSTIDAWLRAADGDASGLWAMSVLADLIFPGSFVWGEAASSVMADAGAVDAYYAGGGDPGSILGNAATDFLWGGGRLTRVWPASPDDAAYRKVMPSQVETLLVGGELDFSTPARVATEELLPALPHGRQVILAGLGHATDFWHHRPEAGQRMLTAFFDRGAVDDSGYGDARPVEFETAGPNMSDIAWILVGTLTGGVLAAGALLGWMVLRVRRRGRFGPKASVWLRVLAPVIAGIGGWFLAILVVSSLWPGVFIGGEAVAVVSIGLAAGFGTQKACRQQGTVAAFAGSFLGAWLGFQAARGLAAPLTAVAGAAIGANLAALVLDLGRARLTRSITRLS